MLKPLGHVAMASAAAWIIASGSPLAVPARAQGRGPITFAASAAADVRLWDQQIHAMRRSGELRVRAQEGDPLVPGRTHERTTQYYRGVRVFGGDAVEQFSSAGGQVVSAFGTLYDGIAIDPGPVIDAADASRIVRERSGIDLPSSEPELVILPRDDGRYTLTWRVRAFTTGDLRQYFVDATTGDVVFDYSDLQTQSAAIGRGSGVLGDAKKISATAGTPFTATDRKRPASIVTFDMKGDYTRALNILNGFILPTAGDVASDSDNDWTDPSVVDGHAYAGYTYDYYFKRFGRHGLDNRDIAIRTLVNPVRRSDVFSLYAFYDFFFTNAAYVGDGLIFYGVGLPPGATLGGKAWDFMAGALDVVGHELTHGVTDYTSDLIYLNESGALNEAFSDMMGTSIEFYYQPAGGAKMQADYLVGEDVITPNGIRSMSDPQSNGQPDHYSRRLITSGDNGGVHTNSGIANNAFYLAIEGGTNRTSGRSVTGVGAANREQIEKVFYRAFTQLMPANATFSVARAATIQAARDLYPSNSNVERAVTDAWTAVGVS